MKIAKILKLCINELNAWFEYFFITNFPGKTGLLLRMWYWSNKFRSGRSFKIGQGCTILDPDNISLGKDANIMHDSCLYANNNGCIELGDRVSINSYTILAASDNGKISIGNDVLIGPNVVIRASNHLHNYKNLPINEQGHSGGIIVVEDDVWIGENCVLLPGSYICKGSIIAAGSVVNAKIAPYSLAAGIPVKVIKEDCRT